MNDREFWDHVFFAALGSGKDLLQASEMANAALRYRAQSEICIAQVERERHGREGGVQLPQAES